MSSLTCDDMEFGCQANLNLESGILGIELYECIMFYQWNYLADSDFGASSFSQNGKKEQDTQNVPESLDEKYEIANPKSAITNSENASNLVGLNFQHFCKLYQSRVQKI